VRVTVSLAWMSPGTVGRASIPHCPEGTGMYWDERGRAAAEAEPPGLGKPMALDGGGRALPTPSSPPKPAMGQGEASCPPSQEDG